MRNASDRAFNHFEAARVELRDRVDRMTQTMLNQAEHAAHQGADIRRLAAQLNDFQFQRPHREIIDPKFPTWNGSRETIEQWLLHLTEFIALKNLPDLQAVGYAKLAMPHHCRDVLRTLPEDITWAQFCDLCLEKFQPRHQQYQLHSDFDLLKMEGNHLQEFMHKFKTLISKLHDKSDAYLLRTFIRGFSHKCKQEELK